MSISSFSKRRHGATLAGIFSLALGGVLLLCGAGTVPVENFAPQGAMQSDLNAGGHNLTNAATVSATNVIVSGTLTVPPTFNLTFAQLTGTPTTLGGYGITDPVALTTGTYANPSWVTSLAYAKLTGAPTIPAAQINSDWNASSGLAQILNKPSLATVATTGSYTDLSGKPALGALAAISPTGTATSTTFLKYDGTTFSYAVPPGLTTSGSSLLYGNGSGGAANATVGGGLSFSTGTLTANVSSVAGRTGAVTLAAADVTGAVAAANNGSDFSSALTTAQNLGVSFSRMTAESGNFTVAASDRGTLFNVTTGTATVSVTLPAAVNGMFFAVRKADSGTGTVSVNSKAIGTVGNVIEVFSDGTSFYSKFLGGTVDASGNYSFTEPANGTYNIITSGTGTFQINGSSIPTSVANSDGSLTISPTTGAVIAGLNYAHSGTWTSPQVISASGGASTAGFMLTGNQAYGGTGTTTLPYFFLQPTGATAVGTWSTGGTMLGVNTSGGFGGNFLDFHVNGGGSVFSVTSSGSIVDAGSLTVSSSGGLKFSARTQLLSPINGTFELTNAGSTAFSGIQLGGTTSAFGGLFTNGTETDSELADQSARAPFGASTFNSSAAQTTVSGSTSGTAIFSQPLAGASFKVVAIHLAALSGTASYTFPSSFINAPHEADSLGLATTISTTAVTVTGTTTTQDLILIGY